MTKQVETFFKKNHIIPHPFCINFVRSQFSLLIELFDCFRFKVILLEV